MNFRPQSIISHGSHSRDNRASNLSAMPDHCFVRSFAGVYGSPSINLFALGADTFTRSAIRDSISFFTQLPVAGQRKNQNHRQKLCPVQQSVYAEHRLIIFCKLIGYTATAESFPCQTIREVAEGVNIPEHLSIPVIPGITNGFSLLAAKLFPKREYMLAKSIK